MALKSSFQDAGLHLWSEWSMTAENYSSTDKLQRVWRGFKPPFKSTIASVFRRAKDNGWQPNTPPRAIQPRVRFGSAPEYQALKTDTHALNLWRNTTFKRHPYLDRKAIYTDVPVDEENNMVIPMYLGKYLVSLQLIDPRGQKRFLPGTKTKNASFTFGSGYPQFICEGFANGLLANLLLSHLLKEYSVKVAFSAYNISNVAVRNRESYILADNDRSGIGEKVARETGLPYWLPEHRPSDLTDLYQDRGLFDAVESLEKFLRAP